MHLSSRKVVSLINVSFMHLAGNLWANDENKFGHKLMEKMGWEKGKGLGANQVNSDSEIQTGK